MKLLRSLLDKQEKLFTGDGPLRKLHPFYDAMDTFLYDPNLLTRVAPYIRDAINVKRYMIMVVLCLLPPTMMAIYNNGLRALAIIVVSYAVGGIVESLFSVVRDEPISEGFLVTGLLFPLTLPVTTPLWQVAVGVAFGVVFGKEVFGGTGHNPFNPALVSRCFVLIAYPVDISPDKWLAPGTGLFGNTFHYYYFARHEGLRAIFDWLGSATTPAPIDAVSGATALGAVSVGGLPMVRDLFSYWDMFVGHIPGSIGETSALACVLGGVLLCATKVGNWRVPFSMLATVAVLSGILYFGVNPLLGDVPPAARFEDPLFHLLVGGMMLGAFYMATDPVSSPVTDTGRYIYGILIGVGAVLIRELTGYPEGVMFAILLGNVFAPLIDEFVYGRVRRKEAGLVPG